MAKKENKYGFKQAQSDFWETFRTKNNEVKGIYMGSDNAPEAVNALANMYSKGGEIEMRIKDAKLNVGMALVDAAFQGLGCAQHELDQRTLINLNAALHLGDSQLTSNARNYRVGKLKKRITK